MTRPSIYGPPNNNACLAPAAPVVGIDGRLWCPACRGPLNRNGKQRTCPDCLQPLWIEIPADLDPAGHVQDRDIDAAGVKR